MKRLAALAFAVSLALCACSRTGSAGTGVEPGVLRVEDWANPNSLDPLLATNTSDNFLASLAFDLLVTLDDKHREVPDLAAVVPTLRNGGISRDGLTVTYHLRHGVKWQDGAPFTSADVKFSWQAVMNPDNNVVERLGYDDVRSVDTPDPYTVVFHLKRPFAPFVDTVFGESDDPFRIVPKHLLARYPNVNHVPFNAMPVGTGPFRVVRWIRGDQIVYAANDAYFRGRPKLRKIVVRFVTDDNTREADLRAHSSDLANDLSEANIGNLRGDPEVKLVLPQAPAYTAIDLNLAHPPLNDVRVRRALAYAINAPAILRDDAYGTGTPATEDLSPFYWAYDPNVRRFTYDPARARALLASAGWRAGPGGLRSKDGNPLVLQLAIGQGNPTARNIAVQVQSQLREVGVDVRIKTYNFTLLYATQQLGGILTGGKYDLALYVWIAGADPDDSQQWMCQFIPPNGNDITHYCNARFDAAEKLALEHFDRATRKRAYALTQSLLHRDVPAVFLYYGDRRYAVSPELRNFRPNGVSEGWNAYRWSI